MNEKDLYMEFNNVNTDEHEFDDINICMTDIQKSRLKSNLRKHIKTSKFIKTKIAAACAACLIFLIGICYANPTLAAQFPFLNPIVEMLGRTGDYAKYSEIINKTITLGGNSFTINSVVCFDNNILIGYTAESDKKINQRDTLFWPIFKVDGKRLDGGSSSLVKKIDENTVMGTIGLTSKDFDFPDNFNFEMYFNGFNASQEKWDFKLKISKAELSKDVKTFIKNQAINYGKYNFTITKVTLTPLNTVISYHGKDGHLFPGNFFIILDDKGNEIKTSPILAESIDTHSVNGEFDCTLFFSKTDMNAKYLKIIPYKDHEPIERSNYNSSQGPEDKSLPITTKLPFELSEGKRGKVEVSKITYYNDYNNVNIQGIIYGKLPDHQMVILEGDNPTPNGALPLHTINSFTKKIGPDKYEFTIEYTGLKSDKNYRIIAKNLDYYLDLNSEIKIMLDN